MGIGRRAEMHSNATRIIHFFLEPRSDKIRQIEVERQIALFHIAMPVFGLHIELIVHSALDICVIDILLNLVVVSEAVGLVVELAHAEGKDIVETGDRNFVTQR